MSYLAEHMKKIITSGTGLNATISVYYVSE